MPEPEQATKQPRLGRVRWRGRLDVFAVHDLLAFSGLEHEGFWRLVRWGFKPENLSARARWSLLR
jgi:hypothetical protein